jgi:hypothetical protein
MGESKSSSEPRRALILWALLAKENGTAYQNALKPEPSKADRDALERDGLVAVSRVGPRRRYFLEATDKGWQWAGEHLDAALPANCPAASKILEAWLKHLKAFLAAHDFVLADVFGAQAQAATGDLWAQLRTAYLQTTGGKLNTRALLKDIRARLDVDRPTLDVALKAYQADAKLQLYPSDNRLELTEADKAAAVQIGGEPRHIVWIEK